MTKKPDPKYKVSDTSYYLLYTTKEGGNIHVFLEWTLAEFKLLEKRGWFEFRPGDYVKRVYPAHIILVKEIDARDFIIDEINEDKSIPRERIVLT